MLNSVKVTRIDITAETVDRQADRRALSGTARLKFESDRLTFEMDLPFLDQPSHDAAVRFALHSLADVCGSLEQAARLAKVEYGRGN